MIKSYKTRFQKFSALLSDPEIAKYARQNGNHAFSRKRKMPLKDMLLCCLSKKGLTTTFELRNYFKEKGDLLSFTKHHKKSFLLMPGVKLPTSPRHFTCKKNFLKKVNRIQSHGEYRVNGQWR